MAGAAVEAGAPAAGAARSPSRRAPTPCYCRSGRPAAVVLTTLPLAVALDRVLPKEAR
jgi:hypothetical protein